MAKKHISTQVRLDGEAPEDVAWGPSDAGEAAFPPVGPTPPAPPEEPTARVRLAEVVGTRSGDKGGTANLGVWARTPEAYGWLWRTLTVERLVELLPEVVGLRLERHEFPNLWALNFVIEGYLERGVSSCTRIDPQAKGLGEYLSSRSVELPVTVLPQGTPAVPAFGEEA